MSKIGFIVKNKANGREYFYLRKSIRSKDLVSKQNLYSFGNRDKAIESLSNWTMDMTKFPEELKNLGYNVEDVLSWIEQIKNK